MQQKPKPAWIFLQSESDQRLHYLQTESIDTVEYNDEEKKPHYKNTPIQIHRKFHLQKLKKFR